MKIYLKLVFISTLLFACSSGGDDTPPELPVSENKKPTIPTLVYPTNNLLCIDNTLEFSWNISSDPDGDAITYNIEVSKDNQFSTIDFTTSSTLTKHTFTLEKGIAYYWRVQATDSKNESNGFSSIFNLYTEGIGLSNHLPFSPELVGPILNATETEGTITLEWKGSDTDGDPLTYDVYFDENNPPTTLVSENQIEQTLNVNTTLDKSYYWKVIVKDDKGGESIGQIWGFSTN
jgi:hypothetical protein